MQKQPAVDLTNIADPNLISLPELHPGDVGIGNPFKVVCESIEAVQVLSASRLLLACDNNLPNTGRNPNRADDTEIIVVDVPGSRATSATCERAPAVADDVVSRQPAPAVWRRPGAARSPEGGVEAGGGSGGLRQRVVRGARAVAPRTGRIPAGPDPADRHAARAMPSGVDPRARRSGCGRARWRRASGWRSGRGSRPVRQWDGGGGPCSWWVPPVWG